MAAVRHGGVRIVDNFPFARSEDRLSDAGGTGVTSLKDVRLRDALVFGGILAALLVAAGLLDQGTARLAYFSAAAAGGALSLVLVAPRRVWLEDGALRARRLGSTSVIALDEVTRVSLPVEIKAGPFLFFERSDGSGVAILRLDQGSLPFRRELGRQISQVRPGPKIERPAAPLLGLDRESR